MSHRGLNTFLTTCSFVRFTQFLHSVLSLSLCAYDPFTIVLPGNVCAPTDLSLHCCGTGV